MEYPEDTQTTCMANCVSLFGSLSLTLQTAHCVVKEGELIADVYELGVSADKHRIITLEGLVGRFPHQAEELVQEREKFKWMEWAENYTL